jgi:hypothetical protein
MPVFRERGLMRDLLIETQTREPAPGQVHAQFFHQLALAADAVQIANQQNAQQQLGINRRSARLAVTRLQPLAHEGKADVPFYESQLVAFWNLIFQPKAINQRLPAGMPSHHEQQASKCNGEQQHWELWPAYNANLAPPQASTEGLFQQTQAFSPSGWKSKIKSLFGS